MRAPRGTAARRTPPRAPAAGPTRAIRPSMTSPYCTATMTSVAARMNRRGGNAEHPADHDGDGEIEEDSEVEEVPERDHDGGRLHPGGERASVRLAIRCEGKLLDHVHFARQHVGRDLHGELPPDARSDLERGELGPDPSTRFARSVQQVQIPRIATLARDDVFGRHPERSRGICTCIRIPPFPHSLIPAQHDERVERIDAAIAIVGTTAAWRTRGSDARCTSTSPGSMRCPAIFT